MCLGHHVYMLPQHHAIGLQTGHMVVCVLAPVVEAARLPRVCPMALGYGLPPCTSNIGLTTVIIVDGSFPDLRKLTLFSLVRFACSEAVIP